MGKIASYAVLFCFFFLSMTTIAVGEVPAPPAEVPWWSEMLKNFLSGFPEINAWFMAAMALVMGLLRVTSEFLLFIHKKTETKADDNLLTKVNGLLKWAATITAWFGAGKPKSLEKPEGQ